MINMCRISFVLAMFGLVVAPLAVAVEHPVIPGLIRDGLDSRLRGHVLLGELGCVSCHSPGPLAKLIHAKKAPDLSHVGSRVRPDYLRAFIADPHGLKPGTTMPSVLSGDLSSRDDASDAVTHYLVSLSPRGFEVEASDHVAAVRGRELFHDIGCIACHAPRDKRDKPLPFPGSAPLERLHEKYSVQSLTAFLEAPHEVRPSGRMPDLHLSSVEAHQLASYLTKDLRVPGPLRYTLFLDSMEEGPEKLAGKEIRGGLAGGFDLSAFGEFRDDFALRFEGWLEITNGGEYRFDLSSDHVTRLRIDERSSISLAKASRQSATIGLDAGLHAIDLVYLHMAGEPRLDLQMSGPDIARSPIPSSMLRSEESPAEPYTPFVVDAAKAARGKRLFTERGCVRCHQIVPSGSSRPLPGLTDMNAKKGCLSMKAGSWPSFSLSEVQVADLRAALADTDFAPTAEQKIRTTLARLNCIACHERGEFGGVPQSRNGYYRSVDENLGEPGRLPPPLTGVGAKLQHDWLSKTVADGQQIRPYMNMRMPAFGDEAVGELADLLSATDHVPAVSFEPLPKDKKKARAVRDGGRRLVGNKGMNCIACHTFRGRGTSSMAAVDMIETTTKRLRKDWFYHYMLEPARFRASTIMPQYFPGGESINTEVEDGDPKRQLNAMWSYLADGRNTGAPSGMTRPSMEIVVGDEAVLLRRSAQGSGKRAISVGYPLKLNLIFDAEGINLDQCLVGSRKRRCTSHVAGPRSPVGRAGVLRTRRCVDAVADGDKPDSRSALQGLRSRRKASADLPLRLQGRGDHRQVR
jgi:mono/diheme cytochrome c family protein